MSNSYFRRRIADLNKVRQNNIVYTDLSNGLTESIFKEEFQKAAEVISNIIKRNQIDGTNEKRPLDIVCREYQTAVPFIGSRGTGKTSIMYSVLRYLRDYPCENGKHSFIPELQDNIRFIAFEFIDAGSLKKTEDMMEIILSRMLSYLEDNKDEQAFRNQDGKLRSIYQQIEALYGSIDKVFWQKSDVRETTSLRGLKKIADSQNAVENFRTLVADFAALVSHAKYRGKTCYLVLALDDVDLYQGSCRGIQDSPFTLLEYIYNFLRIPGLIVLMTYNEHILKRKCNNHFEDVCLGKNPNRRLSFTDQDEIERLTAQFMAKLFPQDQRIYLPNYLLMNAGDSPDLWVRPTLLNDEGNEDILSPFKTKDEVPAKEFMLRLIADRTGVYFDAAGTKKHFFEPRNLRKLGERFSFFFALEDILPSNAGREAIRSRNREALLSYINNQFATEHLYGRANKRFRDLCMVPLVRQDRLLIDEIMLHRCQIAKTKDDLGYVNAESLGRWKYSYGELLHNLYFATRIAEEPGSKESFFPKQLVHCILAAHSTRLNQIMQLPNARTMLLEIIGFSIAGRWANEMLPAFYSTDGAVRKSVSQLGSVSIPLKHFFNFKLPAEVQSELCSVEYDAEENNYLCFFFDALFILGMFFSHFPTNGLGIEIEADQGEDGKSALYLRSRSEENVCFNVWNFSVNSYRALPSEETKDDGYLVYIRNKLAKLKDEFAVKFFDQNVSEEDMTPLEKLDKDVKNRPIISPAVMDRLAAEREKLSEDIKKQKAWKDIAKLLKCKNKSSFMKRWEKDLETVYMTYVNEAKKWEKENPDRYLVLPVQHFDMMYNIIKRLANNSYHDIPEEANINELYDYYKLLYKSMDSELSSQDHVYFKNGENGFAYAFTSSRFYRVVTAEEGTKDYNPILRPLLDAMMQSVAESRRAEIAESNPFRL